MRVDTHRTEVDTQPTRRPYDGAGMTLEQCAEHLGVSRQRVQQIEAEALRKVRRALAERGIKSWHFLVVRED